MTIHATDVELRSRFDFFQGEALKDSVLISQNGRPKTVLMSYEEYLRLKRSDRQAYDVSEIPPHLTTAILETTVPDDY